MLHAQEHASLVDVDHLVPRLQAGLVERRHAHDAGVVYQHIQFAVGPLGGFDGSLPVAFYRYVQMQECGCYGRLSYLCSHSSSSLFKPVSQPPLRLTPSKWSRAALANTPSSS